MEKVKLTQEQADAIKKLKAEASNKEIIYMNTSPFGGIHLDKDKQTIFEMDLDELIRALYIGYEVESEFKVGDWVVTSDFLEPIRKVKEVNDRLLVDNTGIVWRDFGEIRHATPEEIAKEKERRWFAKHGRNPWELKEGDILSEHGNCQTRTIYRVCPLTKSVKFYGDVEWTRKYEIRSNYLVACFAEDRKDV